MVFPTVEFALFFLLVAALSWSTVAIHRLHKAILLVASYVFYGFWDVDFIPLLFALSAVAWLVARILFLDIGERGRRLALTLGIVTVLATLIFFKYTGFAVRNLAPVLSTLGIDPSSAPNPVLPLGISFIVFHAISLMIDASRKKLAEAPTLADALLYVSFFPQLVAGPILRANQFVPQLATAPDPQRIALSEGVLLILLGLFKKVVLADYLAGALVDPFYADPSSFGSLDAWLAFYAYAVQIYCDFSGYTDIAIGCALLLGYRFPDNFNRPYTSASPQEFWRRWHISLSTWLRDYLYISLGGSRAGQMRMLLALFTTMLLGGLWHGANWTFVVWGAYHGLLLVVHRLWLAWRPAQQALTGVRLGMARLLTFHLVCIGWILFRASDFETALSVGEQILSGATTTNTLNSFVLQAIVLGIFGQYLPENWHKRLVTFFTSTPPLLRGALAGAGVMLIEVAGPVGVAPFIYFQF